MGTPIRSVAWAPTLSRLAWLSTVLAVLVALVKGVAAHELRPAIADVTVGPSTVTMRVELALEALVAEVDVSQIDDTDQSPNAARYDELRALEPAALEAELRAAWDGLTQNFLVTAGDVELTAQIGSVEIPAAGDIDLVRDSVLTLTAVLPDDDSQVAVGWTANNGPLVVREMGATDGGYSALLDGGQMSEPLPRQGPDGFGARAWRFLFGE